MKLKKALKSLLIISSIFIALTSCKNNLLQEEVEKAYLDISVNDASRTILPDFNLDEMGFTLKGKLNGGTERILGEFVDYKFLTTDIVALETGDWEFTLEAYVSITKTIIIPDDFKNGYINGEYFSNERLGGTSYTYTIKGTKFSSTINQSIFKGTNPISFNLSPYSYDADGTGDFYYWDSDGNYHDFANIGYTNSVGKVDVTLTLPETSNYYVKAKITTITPESAYATAVTYENEICEVVNHTATYKKENINCGYYELKFEIYSDATYSILVNTYKELVKIAAGCTSKGEITLTQLNTKFYDITYVLGDGNFATGYTAPACFTPNIETKLPNAAQVIRNDGYVLEAFYDNPEFTGKELTSVGNLEQDITVYAKWVEGILVTPENISTLDLSSRTDEITICYSGELVHNEYYGDYRARTIIADKINSSGAYVNLIISDATDIPNQAFYGCSQLKSVRIPEGISSIGNYAFYSSSVESVYLPTSIKLLKECAFYSCSNLHNVYITDLAAYLNINAESYSMPFSSTSESTINKIFLDGQEITDLSIPETVKIIPSYAFQNCKTITTVHLPSSLEEINYDAFSNCTKIKNLYISDFSSYYNAITNVDNATNPLRYSDETDIKIYINNEEVTSINIPSGTRIIPSYAFYNWKSIETISIPSSISEIKSYAFSYSGLKNITVPGSVHSIENYTFEYCSDLIDVILSEGITSIGYDAFEYCNNLKTISLPTTLASIGSWAFYGCNNLKSVYITDQTAFDNISFDSSYSNPTYYGAEIVNKGTSYKLTLIDGRDDVESQEITYYGNDYVEPEYPTDDTLVFGGWYTESNTLSNSFRINADTTLYGKWKNKTGITVTIAENAQISLTKTETQTQYTFTASEGYANYQWLLNGNVVQNNTSNILLINKSELVHGIYIITLIANDMMNTNYDSADITIEVTE